MIEQKYVDLPTDSPQAQNTSAQPQPCPEVAMPCHERKRHYASWCKSQRLPEMPRSCPYSWPWPRGQRRRTNDQCTALMMLAWWQRYVVGWVKWIQQHIEPLFYKKIKFVGSEFTHLLTMGNTPNVKRTQKNNLKRIVFGLGCEHPRGAMCSQGMPPWGPAMTTRMTIKGRTRRRRTDDNFDDNDDDTVLGRLAGLKEAWEVLSACWVEAASITSCS